MGVFFKLWKGSRGPTFKFWGGPGSWVQGSRGPESVVLVPLLHHAWQISRNNIEVLMTSAFQTLGVKLFTQKVGIISTVIFIDPQWAYSTNNPIYLTPFDNSFTKRGKSILVCQHYFLFWKVLSCFFAFLLVVLVSILVLSVYVWFDFVNFSFLFLVLLQFILQGELAMSPDFSLFWFVRLAI